MKRIPGANVPRDVHAQAVEDKPDSPKGRADPPNRRRGRLLVLLLMLLAGGSVWLYHSTSATTPSTFVVMPHPGQGDRPSETAGHPSEPIYSSGPANILSAKALMLNGTAARSFKDLDGPSLHVRSRTEALVAEFAPTSSVADEVETGAEVMPAPEHGFQTCLSFNRRLCPPLNLSIQDTREQRQTHAFCAQFVQKERAMAANATFCGKRARRLNPCWVQGGVTSCIPHFFILGEMKYCLQ